MSFNEIDVNNAFIKAGRKCERCGKQLVWENRGREGRGCWEAHHKNRSMGDIPSNIEILCFECHTNTGSFGRAK